MKYIRRIFVLSLLTGFCFQTSEAFSEPNTNDKLVITHGPYLQQPTENSITIVWFTNKKCVSKVEYRMDDNLHFNSKELFTAISSHHGLIDANTKIHKIRITGLEPGKTYRYRVISKQIVEFRPYEVVYGRSIASKIYRFKTLDTKKSKFSFCMINDVHEHSKKLDARLQAISWDDVDLMFYNGDIINHFENERQLFDGFLDVSVERFAKEIPFVYIRGNHETRGLLARNLMDYFPSDNGRFYYSFNQGPVHFIILDSGEDKPDSNIEYSGLADFDRYRSQQAQWLKEDIQSESFKKARFKIVLMHMPPYGGNGWHGKQQLRKVWGTLLNQADIDLMLCGHTHQFARIEPSEGENTYPIVIGSTATTIRVDVSKKQLKITVIRIDGEVLDTFTIS